MDPPQTPVRDTTGLHSRVRALEATLQRTDTIKPSFLEVFKQKKEAQVEAEFLKLEERFYSEISMQFDVSDRRTFLAVVKFAVKFVAENAIPIASMLAFPITGALKGGLVVKLLANLFTDITEELLTEVVQHVYTLTFVKENDTRTIQMLENKVTEINVGGQKNEPVHPPRKGIRRLFSCFRH